MKKLTSILSIFAIFILFLTPIQANPSQDAVSYMEDIFLPLQELKDEKWKYLKASTRGKGVRKVENKRQKLIKGFKEARVELKRKGGFQGDQSLKNSVLLYLDMSHAVLSEDFDKILDMEEIAEQSYDLMEAYLLAKEKAKEKLDEAYDVLKEAQESFANENNIRLIEGEADKMTQKIQHASALLKHYNEIYLIFFKVYKQEAYTLDALKMNDVGALEQNSRALAALVEEGFDKLSEAEGFEGDGSLKQAARQMIQFYQTEAATDFPAMVDFYLKKDKFDQAKQRMDSLHPKKRTQKDINMYNTAVNEFNEAVNTFNQLNESTYERRARHIKQWNKQVDQFFDAHSK